DNGHVHFNMTALMRGPDSLVAKLGDVYHIPALVPASPWLGAKAPGRPTASLKKDPVTGDFVIALAPAANEKVWLWTVRTEVEGVWTTEVLPGAVRTHRVNAPAPDRVLVTAVSRTGIESPVVTLSAGRAVGSHP